MTTMNKHIVSLVCLAAFAVSAQAGVNVTAPWVRATVPAQKSTGAFMYLSSPTDARLVGVGSPVAERVEMHQMVMNGTTMKMDRVDGIDLPAGKGVNLAAGGYHVMLMGLKRQLKAGEAIDLTLQVRGKDGRPVSVKVRVPVKPINFVSPGVPDKSGHMGH